MAENQNITGFGVGRDFIANDIRFEQNINNTIQSADPQPKNIRFKVKEPIQTFTGREAFLEELHKLVEEGQDGKEGGATVLTKRPFTVVAATGGMGKTETVRVYLQLHAQEYDNIIWIDAEENSFAKRQFLQLAMELKIFTDFEGKPKEFESILKEIFEKLVGNVLLVFDNAEAYEEDGDLKLSGIRDLIPESLSPPRVKPTIIVTSRNQNWPLQKMIHLDLWTEAEVVIFVIGRLGLEKTPANETLALQLGNLFGRLPIALQSAVAVILQQIKRRKKYGIQSLIDEYEKGSRKVLAQKPSEANMRPDQTSITMLVLWNISLEKIVRFEDGELAIKILCFMSYMSPIRIPQDFLFALFKNSFTEDCFENALEILEDYSLIASSDSHHATTNTNQTTQDATVKNLGVNRSNKSYSYDLVNPGVSLTPEQLQTARKLLDDFRERSRIAESPDSDPRSLSIHRMIQDATLENLRSNNNNEGLKPRSIFYENTFSNETQVLHKLSAESMNYIGALTEICCGGELVENLIQITNHVSTKLHDQEFKDLTKKVAGLLRLTKNFAKYAELLQRVMGATPSSEILEQIELKCELATAYKDGGQVQKSLDLYLEALEELTPSRGPRHADTLNIKFFVADALRLMGKYDEAAGKFKELLQDFESNEDTQSPVFLQTKIGYAVALLCQLQTEQSLQEALQTLREVMQEQEKNPDLNSEKILETKFNIASVLEAQGRFQEAATIMFQNILDADKKHRPTSLFKGDCLRKYAKILIQQGKQDEAPPILLQLLEGEESHLGPEHPSTLHTRNELALLYVAAKEFEKAVALLDVEVFRRVFGPENPNTTAASSNLAFAMMKLENFEEAVPLFLDICKIRSQVLGPNHPSAVAVLEALKNCQERLRERTELVESFVELTWVSEEVGRSLLQASNWNMEVAIHTFFDEGSNESIGDLEGLDQTLIPLRTTTAIAQNENVESISSNTAETSQTQDPGIDVESVPRPQQLTTSILFRLADGTRLRGEFRVSSTVQDLYEFVNEERPDLPHSNYVLTFYPNIELTDCKMGETLEEANLLNAALTQKILIE